MPKYAPPAGKIVKGFVIRLEPTPEQAARFTRDCGARRFAYNWAITEICNALAAGAETGEYDNTIWSAWSLRKRWNQVKAEIAPWWAENNKESYSNGIADAVTGLKRWHGTKTGKHNGPAVRFPRHKKRFKDPLRCTYTAGVMHVDDSRTITLPKAGKVRTAENIRALWRHFRRGTARLLSATIREKAGHWSVSLSVEITPPRKPEPRTDTVGVDLGLGEHLLIVMRPDGAVAEKVPNPRALQSSLKEISGAHRAMARKVPGSSRWHKARRRLARLHGHAAAMRKDAIHKATTRLAKTHGAVVIEDLAVWPRMRGLKHHRKLWMDAAAGDVRRQLLYKADLYGCDIWLADRWYPSSKTCSACGQVNKSLTLKDRYWACGDCGATHQRDENAGTNLARLPAGRAEAQSDGKTASVRLVASKRVNHLGKVAA